VAGGLKPSTLSSRGTKWGSLKDTQFMECSGTAQDKNGKDACVWDIRCGRVAAVGTFCQVHVKMSKFTPNSGMGEYTPEEFTVRFPEEPDVNAHWSDVWPKSFKSSI
jgi:hypothetical protein